MINEQVGNKYFTNKNDVTVAKHDIFLKEKPANTFRIFILGASSSIGFPYKNATTFDLSIKYQLSHLFPEKKFEVVNLSLNAVNSFTFFNFPFFKKFRIKDEETIFLLISSGCGLIIL